MLARSIHGPFQPVSDRFFILSKSRRCHSPFWSFDFRQFQTFTVRNRFSIISKQGCSQDRTGHCTPHDPIEPVVIGLVRPGLPFIHRTSPSLRADPVFCGEMLRKEPMPFHHEIFSIHVGNHLCWRDLENKSIAIVRSHVLLFVSKL